MVERGKGGGRLEKATSTTMCSGIAHTAAARTAVTHGDRSELQRDWKAERGAGGLEIVESKEHNAALGVAPTTA